MVFCRIRCIAFPFGRGRPKLLGEGIPPTADLCRRQQLAAHLHAVLAFPALSSLGYAPAPDIQLFLPSLHLSLLDQNPMGFF